MEALGEIFDILPYVLHGRVDVAEITNTSRRARPSTLQA
jgi:hypothetical protein